VVAGLLERDDAFGSAYNLAGTPTTTRAFARAIYAAAGKPFRYVAVGPPLVWLLGRFDPLMRELVEMLYLQSQPVLLEDAKLRAVLGEPRRTPYAEGIRATLDAAERGAGSP
jgi:nucleoside-diphosphate-sugar epimerase